MICRNCGREIRDGAKFCPWCGADQTKADVIKKADHAIKVDPVIKKKKETKPEKLPAVKPVKRQNTAVKKPVIAAVAVAGVVLVVACGFLFLNKNKAQNVYAQKPKTAMAVKTPETETDVETEKLETVKQTEIETETAETVTETKVPEIETEAPETEWQPETEEVIAEAETEAPPYEEDPGPEARYINGRLDRTTQEYILPDSDKGYYMYDNVCEMTQRELMLARNEIYARHGRKFNDPEIQAYFDSKSWYHGYIEPEDFPDDILNEYEEANIELIQAFED